MNFIYANVNNYHRISPSLNRKVYYGYRETTNATRRTNAVPKKLYPRRDYFVHRSIEAFEKLAWKINIERNVSA